MCITWDSVVSSIRAFSKAVLRISGIPDSQLDRNVPDDLRSVLSGAFLSLLHANGWGPLISASSYSDEPTLVAKSDTVTCKVLLVGDSIALTVSLLPSICVVGALLMRIAIG
ncbi:hypothetical protein Tco_0536326 [Tanacetum coccineum]